MMQLKETPSSAENKMADDVDSKEKNLLSEHNKIM